MGIAVGASVEPIGRAAKAAPAATLQTITPTAVVVPLVRAEAEQDPLKRFQKLCAELSDPQKGIQKGDAESKWDERVDELLQLGHRLIAKAGSHNLGHAELEKHRDRALSANEAQWQMNCDLSARGALHPGLSRLNTLFCDFKFGEPDQQAAEMPMQSAITATRPRGRGPAGREPVRWAQQSRQQQG